jgi:hypothetical protein
VKDKGEIMKQKICVIAMTLLMVCVSVPCFAWYYAMGAGSGGSADATALTLEIGKRDVTLFGRPFLVAGAVPLILHGDRHVPDGTDPGPIDPGNQEYFLSSENDGTENGLLGKLGMEIKESDCYVTLILGLTQANTVSIAHSNITGDTYIQGEGDEMNGVFGIGVSYFPVFQDGMLNMIFQLDIDNRRGITGSLGWCW